MATLPNPLPKLAADPSGRTLGLELPPGKLIDAGGTSHALKAVGEGEAACHEPLLWHADAPATPGAWSALEPARRTSGLLPSSWTSAAPKAGRRTGS